MSVGAWLHVRGSSEAARVIVELGQVQRLLTLGEARALHGALEAAIDEARATVDVEDESEENDEEATT